MNPYAPITDQNRADDTYGEEDIELNPCGKPHNNYENGDEDGIESCAECQAIKLNL